MATLIICPNCKAQFEPEAAIAHSVEEKLRKEFNQKWVELDKQKEEKFKYERQQLLKQQEEKERYWQEQQKEIIRRQLDEKKTLEQELNIKVRADFENQLILLQEINKTNESKLNEAREKELEFLKRMQELQEKEHSLELEIQRKLLEERTKLLELVRREEEEKTRIRETEHQMKFLELQKQLEVQRKLAEDMKRKIEQGSMQLQGEVQELALEELLRNAFPFDVISEVGKGVRGADCIQTVRNSYRQECGKIIFESKRTKDFSEDWIEKLKADMRVLGADVAVIVTHAMPKGMTNFGEKDGIWICTFGEARALVHVLRDAVIKVYNAAKSQENKGDKMTLLYHYLVSSEFAEQWSAIREGFMSMRISIQKERDQMEKMWKAREKQLEKVLLNAAHIKGSIEGIAGMDVDLNLLQEDNSLLLE